MLGSGAWPSPFFSGEAFALDRRVGYVRMVDEFINHVDLHLLELTGEQQRRDAEQLDPAAAAVGDGGGGRRCRPQPAHVVEDGDGV